MWVRSWGDIFDSAERKLSFFRKQLEYEATDERVTKFLRDTYREYIPEALRDPSESGDVPEAIGTTEGQAALIPGQRPPE